MNTCFVLFNVAMRHSSRSLTMLLLLFGVTCSHFAEAQCFSGAPVAVSANPMGGLVLFNWSDNCPAVNNYEIQVLRLFNIDPNKRSETNIKAIIDWDQALSFHTNTGPAYTSFGVAADRQYYLHIAEGRGYYAWRVRRLSGGGYTDPANDALWGAWTSTGSLLQDDTVTITSPNNYIFFHNNIEDDINWTFRREFEEGPITHELTNRIAEKINFSNSLLMPEQEQQSNRQTGGKTVSQTVTDNIGRPAMNTLKVYEGYAPFSYQPNYAQSQWGGPYKPDDFDEEATFRNPSGLMGDVHNFYSNSNTDLRIPSAQGYPFNRTAFYNDGTGRVREIAGPGPEHKMGSDHTVKKYYGKAATTELERILGDEAPSGSSVLKTYTTDPNGVVNVTYSDEAGRTIMTCLTKPPSPLLDELHMDSVVVDDTVTERVEVGPGRLLARATYSFAVPTAMSYVYAITPNYYKDSCQFICSSCDYRIVVTAKERDDTATYRYIQDILPDQCLPWFVTTSHSDQYKVPAGEVMLAPGTYDVSVMLEMGTVNPVTGQSYIDQYVDSMHRRLDTMFFSPVSTGNVIYSTQGKSLLAMLDFLDSNNMVGLLNYVNADTSKPTFTLSYGCASLELPTVRCKTPECAPPKFAEYMKTELKRYDQRKGSSFFAPVYNTGGSISLTTSTANMFIVATDQEFNDIITRMVADGYNCTNLFIAFKKAVQNYITGQRFLAGTATPLSSSMTKYDWWGDFMREAGYKVALEVKPAADLATASTSLRQKPYKYFPYDWGTNTNIEEAFCGIYQGGSFPCVSSGPPPNFYSNTTSGLMASANNFPAGDPSAQTFHMYNFYDAIRSSGTTTNHLNAAIANGALNAGSTISPSTWNSGNFSTLNKLRANCLSMCDARMDGVVSQLASDFMDDEIKVEGYDYDLAWRSPPTDSIQLSKLLCLSVSVVEYCKKGCNTAPDSAGFYLSAARKDTIRNSMFAAMEFKVSATTVSTCEAGYDTVANLPQAKNLGMLYWLNLQKRQKQNANAQSGLSTLNWNPFVPATSMHMSPFDSSPCNLATFDLKYKDRDGYFSFGNPTTFTKTGCSSSSITTYNRYVNDSAQPNNVVKVQVEVALNTALTATDTLVIHEDFPFAIYWAPNHGTSTLGYATEEYIVGPMPAGKTYWLEYEVNTGSTAPYTGQLQGSVSRWTSLGRTVLCTGFNTNLVVDECLHLKYHYFTTPPNDPPKVTFCKVCYDEQPCDGRVCVRYAPKVSAVDTLKRLSCEALVCQGFRDAVITQIDEIHRKHEAILRNRYRRNCQNKDTIKDMFVNNYSTKFSNITLYYYDRAGNLIRTIQPRGFFLMSLAPGANPHYGFRTEYDYNLLGQVLRQSSPDAGETSYWYNNKGQLRLSQNAKQLVTGKFSYTRYDDVGRVVEVGEIGTHPFSTDTLDIVNWPYPDWITNVTRTTYTSPYLGFAPVSGPLPGGEYQRWLRNRVSFVETEVDGDWTTKDDQVVTAYSYDPTGNVELVYQKIPALNYASSTNPNPDVRMIAYENNIFTGKPYSVSILNTDSMIDLDDNIRHRFRYDADSRLMNAHHSMTPGNQLINTARLSYYEHEKGLMRRKEVGFNHQGQDYTYTIHGWLKAISHTDVSRDPGADDPFVDPMFNFGPDGVVPQSPYRKDAYAEILSYYDGDFVRNGSPYDKNELNLEHPYKGLFNGNITAWQQITRPPFGGVPGNRFEDSTTGFLYEYDQLNRLKRTKFYLFDSTNLVWYEDEGYNEMLSVDGGGSVQRNTKDGSAVVPIDEAIVYTSGNKLLNIQDGRDATGEMRGLRSTYKAFGYDQVGNMTEDPFNQLGASWNPYNKPSMMFDTVNKHRYTFLYDGMGNMVRSLRVRIPPNPSDPPVYNFYVRDAAGNELALYQTVAGSATTIAERYLYADDLVGVMKGPNNHSGTDTTFPPAEMYVKDHLGTVRATILDTPTTASWVADPNYPDPEVTSYFNGYAYGAPMYDRVYNSLSVAHGFNGQRKMSELNGNINYAKYWIYDNWLGTRWNLDPVTQFSMSDYVVFKNNPILRIDPLGDREYKSMKQYKKETGRNTLAEGDWLIVDRTTNTEKFRSANSHNLQQLKGYEEYSTIEQRAAFYGWYAVEEELRGGETKWAGAAYIIAKQMTLMDVFYSKGDLTMMYGAKTAQQLNAFANAGNRAIFNDVFDDLRANMNNIPKKGEMALNWDRAVLYNEQFNVVQPIYMHFHSINPALTSILQDFASQKSFSSLMKMPENLKFTGNILSPVDRYNHGMNKAVPFYELMKKLSPR